MSSRQLSPRFWQTPRLAKGGCGRWARTESPRAPQEDGQLEISLFRLWRTTKVSCAAGPSAADEATGRPFRRVAGESRKETRQAASTRELGSTRARGVVLGRRAFEGVPPPRHSDRGLAPTARGSGAGPSSPVALRGRANQGPAWCDGLAARHRGEPGWMPSGNCGRANSGLVCQGPETINAEEKKPGDKEKSDLLSRVAIDKGPVSPCRSCVPNCVLGNPNARLDALTRTRGPQ